jgi:ABC-2 type transport system ATP-binding protein
MLHPAIDVNQLTKRFDSLLAVDHIGFQVAPGETVGLLGGNGAGKTTTIAMMLGLLKPSSGEVRVLGADMVRHRYKVLHRINFSSPYVDLPHRLTVRENLIVYAHLYGLSRPKARIRRLIEGLSLEELEKRRIGSLSAGQKTRVALAKALLNEPECCFSMSPPPRSIPIRRIGSVLTWSVIGWKAARQSSLPLTTWERSSGCARWC